MNDSQEAPKTIREVGLVLGYMRQDIQELSTAVKEASKNYASKEDVKVMQVAADKEHADIWVAINDIKRNAKWWVGTIIAIAAVAVAAISIFK